jgi:hypothetical protein
MIAGPKELKWVAEPDGADPVLGASECLMLRLVLGRCTEKAARRSVPPKKKTGCVV